MKIKKLIFTFKERVKGVKQIDTMFYGIYIRIYLFSLDSAIS